MPTSRGILWRHRRPTLLDPELELFVGSTRRELARAAELFTFIDVDAGRVVARRGQIGREFTVVLSGQVAVSVDGEALAVLEAGHHFGAIPLLQRCGQARRPASFETLTSTSLAVANRAEFNALLRDVPVVAERVHALAAQRLAYFDVHHPAQPVGAAGAAGPPAFPVRVPVAT